MVREPAAAIAPVEAAQRLNPSLGYATLGWCYYLLGRYADAVAMLNRGMPSERIPVGTQSVSPFSPPPTPNWADAAAAARARADLAKVTPFFDRAFFISQFPSETDRAQLRDGLAKAGIGG